MEWQIAKGMVIGGIPFVLLLVGGKLLYHKEADFKDLRLALGMVFIGIALMAWRVFAH